MVESVVNRYKTGDTSLLGRDDWVEWRTTLDLVSVFVVEHGNGEYATTSSADAATF